jgi:hypothetical protein
MQLFITTIVVITSAIQLRINSYSEEKKIPKILTRFVSACGNTAKICPVKCVEMELRACWKDVVSALDFFIYLWMLGLTSMSGDRHQYQIDINSLPYYKTELHPSVKKIGK